jgi:glycosyltransferase involved in cell wall biosynthesis
MQPKIHIIAVAFKRFNLLSTFVQSWINQTVDNWILTVIHDGPDDEFIRIMTTFEGIRPGRIEHQCTNQRFNDYGHTLRDIGLKDIKGDYVLLTNADNYFIPKAIEYINEVFEEGATPEIIIYDMVHSHNRPGGRNLPAYSFFQTDFKPFSIDVSAAIVKSELAGKVGFRDKTHDGDQSYFEDIRMLNDANKFIVTKINRILFVHN